MANTQVGISESILRISVSKYCLIICMILSGLFISCNKENCIEEELPFITKVNMEMMAQQQLPGYQLQGARISYTSGREYVYTKDEQNLFITIGLHPSPEQASAIADEYVSNSSVTMKEGVNLGVSIGDKYWWYPTDETSNLTNIVFIRKNALVILNGPQNSQINLEELARKIDNDLQMNSSYVKRAAEMTSINSYKLEMSKSIYFEGDTAKVTFTAYDINNEPLEYYLDGWSHFNGAENVFTKIITRSYIEEPFPWESKIKWTVINKSNAISTFNNPLHLSY